MKNRYSTLIVLSLLALVFVQCNDDEFFELERPQLFPWNSVDEFELSVVDSYYGFFLNSGWTAPYGYSAYRDFVISDISTHTDHQPLEHAAINQYDRDFTAVSNSEGDAEFAQLYRVLNQILPGLKFIEEKEQEGTDAFSAMTPEDRDQLQQQKGELYFMRAWTNYHLAKGFMPTYVPGGDNSGRYIPLKQNFDETADALRSSQLGSVQEFYDLMLSDLQKAKELLPEQHAKAGRANKYAAATLLYRIKFAMGDHAGALDECDFVITDAVDTKGYYDLSQDPETAWTRNFGDAKANEVIWEVAFRPESSDNDIPFARMTKIGYYRANGGGRGDGTLDENGNVNGWIQSWAGTMALSYYALGRMGWMDMTTNTPTPEALADKRFNQLYYFLKAGADRNAAVDTVGMSVPERVAYMTSFDGNPKVTKNHIWIDKYYRAEDGRYAQLPLMRLAELYLSRAMLRLSVNNDVIGATADVNVVRQRAGLTDLASVTPQSVEEERLRELAGEGGDRMLYMKGFKKEIDGNKFNEAGVAIPAIAFPYEGMYTPVPLGETDYNDNYNN
ncbi:SusD family protein [Zobellia uliginosa]|uniref:SusD family protein n=1 Tax=Zobellia uliginosa TaxID=143224 RepID=A0ABY1L1C0_9FLAO|nr:RagB/SusD family nutrient uptake outer membrane protein [Zobellia uliginosa]SIT08822.1 SusD family protein [Zobellia uliginosa]